MFIIIKTKDKKKIKQISPGDENFNEMQSRDAVIICWCWKRPDSVWQVIIQKEKEKDKSFYGAVSHPA